MATRQSVEECIQHCQQALEYAANEQYIEGLKQEHYNDEEYTNAQQKLQDALAEVEKLSLSANDQQREQLHRMRLQLQHLQNEMILLDH